MEFTNMLEYYKKNMPDNILYLHEDGKRFLVKEIGNYGEQRYAVYDRDNLCVYGYSLRIWHHDLKWLYEWWVKNYDSEDANEYRAAKRVVDDYEYRSEELLLPFM